MSNREVFSRIYRLREWNGDGERSSFSGPGSTPTASKFYVDQVSRFIVDKSISSVTDVGHGDWFMWPKSFFKGISYTGFDVAEGVSDVCNVRFGDENTKFVSEDFAKANAPVSELLLIKDVLGHLTISDIEAILYKASQYKYVIICEGFKKVSFWDIGIILRRIIQLRRRARYAMRLKNPFIALPLFDLHLLMNNKEIETGAHRTLNFSKSPFRLDAYGLELLEHANYQGHDFSIFCTEKRVWFLKGKNCD
jgi:hypothetical protein